jgi:hypothetical protein
MAVAEACIRRNALNNYAREVSTWNQRPNDPTYANTPCSMEDGSTITEDMVVIMEDHFHNLIYSVLDHELTNAMEHTDVNALVPQNMPPMSPHMTNAEVNAIMCLEAEWVQRWQISDLTIQLSNMEVSVGGLVVRPKPES